MQDREELAVELKELKRKFESNYQIETYPGIFRRLVKQTEVCEQFLILGVKKLLDLGAKLLSDPQKPKTLFPKSSKKKPVPPLFKNTNAIETFITNLREIFENAGMRMLVLEALSDYQLQFVDKLGDSQEAVAEELLDNTKVRNFFAKRIVNKISLDTIFALVDEELQKNVYGRLSDEHLEKLQAVFHHLQFSELLNFCSFMTIDYAQSGLQFSDENEMSMVQYFSSIGRLLRLFKESLEHVLQDRQLSCVIPAEVVYEDYKQIPAIFRDFLVARFEGDHNFKDVPTFTPLQSLLMGEDKNIGSSGRFSRELKDSFGAQSSVRSAESPILRRDSWSEAFGPSVPSTPGSPITPLRKVVSERRVSRSPSSGGIKRPLKEGGEDLKLRRGSVYATSMPPKTPLPSRDSSPAVMRRQKPGRHPSTLDGNE